MDSVISKVFMLACTMLIVFNVAYSQASSYKESITDYTKSKTINGYLMLLFTGMAIVGNAVYHIFSGITNIMLWERKSKCNDHMHFMIVGVIDTIAIFMISYIAYKLFGVFQLSHNTDDMTVIEKVIHFGSYIANFFATLAYYGFVYGLFGGDNCRIQDTKLSVLFDKFRECGQAMSAKEIELSKETVKDMIKDEAKPKDKSSGLAPEIISYIKSTIGKTISTVAENFSTLTTLYVGVKNFAGFVVVCMFGIVWSTMLWLTGDKKNVSEEVEEAVESITVNPIDVVLDNVKNFLIIMVVLVLIKIIAKLVIRLTPAHVQNKIYDTSYSLNTKCQDRLNKMSQDSYENDKYADRYASPLIRAAHKANVK